MNAAIVSQTAFEWFVTILTGGLAGGWLVYDVINLIGLVGVVGCLRFHDVM